MTSIVFKPALFIFLLIGAVSVSGQALTPPDVTVFVECVDYNPSTNVLTAYFGYNNPATTVKVINYGGNNFFQPAPNVRGQPDRFQPGINRFAFSTTLDLNGTDKELVWSVGRLPAIATNNVNNYCSRPITYQERLTDGGNASPTGQYDLQFELYENSTGGTALATVALENVQVTNGVFTVQLNFSPDSYNKNNGRFLQIGVRPGTDTGAFTALNPRQELTAAPYAVASGTAVDARKLGGFNADNYVRQTSQGNVRIARPPTSTSTGGGDLSVEGSANVVGNLNVQGTITGNFTVPAGSGNYIQNTTTQQPTSNFNISGNGTVGGNLSVAGNVTGDLRVNGQGTGRAIIGNLFNSNNYTGLSLNNSTANTDYNLLSSPTDKTLYINRPDTFGIQFRKNNVTQMTLADNGELNLVGNGIIGGNLTVSGTLASGCRAGFTAIAGGRLCVSAMQPAATFYGAIGAVQTCINLGARVGAIADVTLTLGAPSFNYFGGLSQGWLGDYGGDNLRPVWNAPSPTPDFDGAPLNVYTGGAGGTAPSLPYRCVY